ncbi:MAG: response regulator [Pyrinomonadaceae bacterium]|nr:response regulator [Pyrinomonadaceae bacterium]
MSVSVSTNHSHLGITTMSGVRPPEVADDKILIVDDSATVRAAFKSQLSKKYRCYQAESFMDALVQLNQSEFALVIADVQMPGISGIELLRKIVERFPETYVIMVSGIVRPQVALDAIRQGAFDYLLKPCDPYVLDITVERALERRLLLRNAKAYKADLETRNAELARSKDQLQRLQTQIIQNAKMASLGQLAAGVAHELNNPAGFVSGNIEMIDQAVRDIKRLLEFYDSVQLDPEAAQAAAALKNEIHYENTLMDLESMVADCRDGADRIRNIVMNLRTFSRLDEAEFKKIDLHEGIDSTARLLSRYFSSDRIRLVREYGDIPQIDAYAGQLNQVWMNLLANAAQALPPDQGGEVRIETRRVDGYVEVAISDSGSGIPQEVLDRIFDPFFTTKPVGEGTGLGLSITFSIVERHLGRIDVQTAVNQGTTFTVRLPINSVSQTVAVSGAEAA